MTLRLGRPARLALGAATFVALVAGDVRISLQTGLSLGTPAHAIIGRPLTPMSYAGVARRSTYRAVGYGAAGYGAVGYGAAAYGAAVAARPVYVEPPVVVVQPTCVDTVDAYGVVTRVCR
ncbi:hypothetical protein [Sphingomonas limnosediminicola]